MSNGTTQKLDVIDTIKEGIAIGSKNIGSILVNIILWVLTCWIPYLNVGTTIGLMTGIVSKASKGEIIPMTEIFDPKYRKYMGEFFLTSGLIGMGIGVGMVLFIIPGIVIAIAWSLALLLVVDKSKNPTEAISLSNQCTYGNKLRMVGVYLLPAIAFALLMGLFSLIAVAVAFLGVLLILALSFFYCFVMIGLLAAIYKRLTENV